ncbi:MAG: TAT-variant-translocated molybdopterin oxidoreductase [Planctomycetota bacterium]|jgi:molybdopterin-containing oxidoreductase family iron-sulfur binding subunit
MPPLEPGSPRGGAWWRSLEELADTPQFRAQLEREFPAGALEMLDSSERRSFLKIMGASLALAGVGLPGCRRWPKEEIAPFAHRPAGRVPGTTEHFATSMERGGVAAGLLVTSYDGRPIKIEGNPEHPTSRGGTDALAQAGILDLYDPDRSRHPLHIDKEGERRQRAEKLDFVAWATDHFDQLAGAQGEGLAVLSEATASPSVLSMRARLAAKHPRATWYEYEPINNDHELAGAVAAFGSPHRPHYSFDRARVIVSLDSDFLQAHPAAVKHTREFARGRRADDASGAMSRLYVFESGFSLTGANADHRFPVRSRDVAAIAGWIASALAPELTPMSADALQHFAAATAEVLGFGPRGLGQIIHDLEAHRGASLIVAGPRQPAAVHALAHRINEHLGNVGRTVRYTAQPGAVPQAASIKALAGEIAAGRVTTLVIIGGNPAYDAPADLDFAAALQTVAASVHLSLYDNETSRLCTWHVPRAHELEAWGDARAWDGTIGIIQPLILPLFGGMSAPELLAVMAADDLTAGYDITRRTFAEGTGGRDVDRLWRQTLHDGYQAGSADPTATPSIKSAAVTAAVEELWQTWTPPGGDAFELVFAQDACVYDGRFANNGWLQELPDPLTKMTWDNAVCVGPEAAARLGVATGDMVRIGREGRAVSAAVCVVPGQHPESVTLSLGYGRRHAGAVGDGAGFDFYPLRTSDAMGIAGGAAIQKIAGRYEFALTQDHHPIDSVGGAGTAKRLPTILREGTLDEYRRDPHFVRHRAHAVHRLSLWNETNLEGGAYAWGMSIDLSACTGCSACVVACQAENNIPIVGKDQVKRGREMHWIRVDRYFKGGAETPEAVGLQPVPCMHCENAPCEQVCPVAATVHDDDGLNVMVYNRCVGTRYCSNNCPYKVRRFNYFDYQKRTPLRETDVLDVQPDYFTRPQSDANLLQRMQFNPEVTVRSRGVMEKCTFCVQRIAEARIEAKNAWVKQPEAAKRDNPRVTVPDGTLAPACAQACPAQAIVFGDLNDPGSRVAQLRGHDRSYEMLEELNLKPRTTYLAKLRNPAAGLAPEGAPPAHEGDGHG